MVSVRCPKVPDAVVQISEAHIGCGSYFSGFCQGSLLSGGHSGILHPGIFLFTLQ